MKVHQQIEQNRGPRNKPEDIQSTDFQQITNKTQWGKE
jgi:hypothetical protein